MTARPDIKPFDVVVVDGLWYMPHHWLIQWRGLDCGVHCATVMNESGEIWNPLFTGIKSGLRDGKEGHIDHYKGRSISIHRFKHSVSNVDKMLSWGAKTTDKSKGYDFLKQWLLGFVLGITATNLANDEERWTCAEFPYWAFQYGGYKLSAIDELLPMPRFFRYSNDFKCIFSGIW